MYLFINVYLEFKAGDELCSNKVVNKAEVVLVITLMSDQEKIHSNVAQMGQLNEYKKQR